MSVANHAYVTKLDIREEELTADQTIVLYRHVPCKRHTWVDRGWVVDTETNITPSAAIYCYCSLETLMRQIFAKTMEQRKPCWEYEILVEWVEASLLQKRFARDRRWRQWWR